MTAPNDLVRGLRYRRWLGRQLLVRGTTPTRSRIKYGLAPGCLGIVIVIVAIYIIALVALAIQMALYVVVALAALLVVRPFSHFALPALRGACSTALHSSTRWRPACSPSAPCRRPHSCIRSRMVFRCSPEPRYSAASAFAP